MATCFAKFCFESATRPAAPKANSALRTCLSADFASGKEILANVAGPADLVPFDLVGEVHVANCRPEENRKRRIEPHADFTLSVFAGFLPLFPVWVFVIASVTDWKTDCRDSGGFQLAAS